MQSTDPKDYYFHVKSSDEIFIQPSQEFDNDTGYDQSLVEINPILDQNDFYEIAEQMYLIERTTKEAITVLEDLGFVHNDAFSKMIKENT